MKKTVVLYNPYAVFYTMPLALIAIGSYLDADKIMEIENFKFYQRLAYTQKIVPIVKNIAKWRLDKKMYALPFERKLKEGFIPTPQMS